MKVLRPTGLCRKRLHDVTAPGALGSGQCRQCKRAVDRQRRTKPARQEYVRDHDHHYRATTKGILATERAYQKRARGA